MDTLAKIAEEIKEGKKDQRWKYAKNGVPGEGSATARIMLIGEAPGATEDLQGRPFVGRAGQLLNELLGSVGLKREDVYITNVIKYRPPGNRDPTPEEVDACKPYLDREIKLVNPEIIVPLGNHALEFVTGKTGISSMHGKIMKKEVVGKIRKIIPTFHPAALIYNQKLRPSAENDFKVIKKELGQKSLGSF